MDEKSESPKFSQHYTLSASSPYLDIISSSADLYLQDFLFSDRLSSTSNFRLIPRVSSISPLNSMIASYQVVHILQHETHSPLKPSHFFIQHKTSSNLGQDLAQRIPHRQPLALQIQFSIVVKKEQSSIRKDSTFRKTPTVMVVSFFIRKNNFLIITLIERHLRKHAIEI